MPPPADLAEHILRRLREVQKALGIDPPADGAALVKLIQQTTGVDLTKELAPRG